MGLTLRRSSWLRATHERRDVKSSVCLLKVRGNETTTINHTTKALIISEENKKATFYNMRPFPSVFLFLLG